MLAPKRLVLRIRSGRVVTPPPSGLTVDDMRSLSVSKLSRTECLRKALLLQNAVDHLDAVAGADPFHDVCMELSPGWASSRTFKPAASAAFSHLAQSPAPGLFDDVAPWSAAPGLSAANFAAIPGPVPISAAAPVVTPTNRCLSSVPLTLSVPLPLPPPPPPPPLPAAHRKALAPSEARHNQTDFLEPPPKLAKCDPNADYSSARVPMLSPTQTRDMISVLFYACPVLAPAAAASCHVKQTYTLLV